jgi:hypothetical protein
MKSYTRYEYNYFTVELVRLDFDLKLRGILMLDEDDLYSVVISSEYKLVL